MRRQEKAKQAKAAAAQLATSNRNHQFALNKHAVDIRVSVGRLCTIKSFCTQAELFRTASLNFSSPSRKLAMRVRICGRKW